MYTLKFSNESLVVLERIVELSEEHEEMLALLMEIHSLLSDIKVKGSRIGIPLQDLGHIHLQGCYKLYCGDAKWRIVMEPIDDETIAIHIIGLRDKLMVYTLAHEIRSEFQSKLNSNE